MMALGRAGINISSCAPCTVGPYESASRMRRIPHKRNSINLREAIKVFHASSTIRICFASFFFHSCCVIFSLLLFDVSVYSSFHRSNNNNWMARRTYFDDNSIKMAMLAAFAHFLCTSKRICVVNDEDDDSNIVWQASSAPASVSSDTIWPEYWHLTLDTSRASDSNTFLCLLCPFFSFFAFFASNTTSTSNDRVHMCGKWCFDGNWR